MRRLLPTGALLAILATAPACGLTLFEDVGSNPHPPEVVLLGIAYKPIESTADGGETEEGETTATTPEPVFYDPEGFVVRPIDDTAKTLIFRVKYADIGGDIVSFTIRDKDSDLNTSVSPSAVEVDIDGDGVLETLDASDYFTGTSGTTDLEDIEFSSKQAGTHHLELWAEDSHGSRSAKVEFTMTVVL